MRWVAGLTTVPSRRSTTLPRTLSSLADAGFDSPRLFVDGDDDTKSWQAEFSLEVTTRLPALRPFGNWLASLWELYLRDPKADRYAMFQDDFLAYPNLRHYLESCEYPQRGYLNLYTFRDNEDLIRDKPTGWLKSRLLCSNENSPLYKGPKGLQNGRGALALVFDHEAVTTLLIQPNMIKKPQDTRRGHKSIDGAVVTAMNYAGWSEYIHNPSLVQHIGTDSTIRDKPWKEEAQSWRGDCFDAMELMG